MPERLLNRAAIAYALQRWRQREYLTQRQAAARLHIGWPLLRALELQQRDTLQPATLRRLMMTLHIPFKRVWVVSATERRKRV